MKSKYKLALSVCGAIVILGGGTFILLSQKNFDYKAVGTDSSLIAVTTESDTSKQAEDLDGDGLSDWEEVLWKTNLSKADSDGDGTSDGDEVKADRDPLKKGPEDSLDGKTVPTAQANMTPTKTLARDILIAHYKLTQDGIDDPEYTIESVLNKNKPALIAVQYESSQFEKRAENPASVNAYGTELATMLNKYLSPDQKNELEILALATEENKEEYVASELKKRGLNYKTMAESMLKIKVPENGLGIHTALANTLSTMATLTDAMSKIFDDPVTALAGLEKYPETGLLLSRNLANLTLYLQSKGTQFTAP